MTELDTLPQQEIERPMETINSDFEIVGTIPNIDDIWESAYFADGMQWEASAVFDEDQQPVISRISSSKSIDGFLHSVDLGEEVNAEVFGMLLPALRIADSDRRATHGRDKTAIGMSIRDQVATPAMGPFNPETSDRIPHTDDYSIGFLSVIGDQTKYWKGEFQVPEGADRAERVQSFVDQVHTQAMVPTIPGSGDIIRIDRDTVHANPSNDPEVAGKRRIFMVFSPVRPEDPRFSQDNK